MSATANSKRPGSAEPSPPVNPWLVLWLVAFGEFMVVLDATIVNVALPSIKQDLGFAPGDLQWVVNGYAVLFGGFLLLGGRAGDLFGRRRVFMLGMTLFTGASLANVLAGSPEVLVAGRALQGLGAAMVSPAALSIITSSFPAGAERAKALSAWAAIAVGGGGVGLLLGGVLTETLSWEWVFLINIPIGVATLTLVHRFVPESRIPARRGFDLGGAVAVTAAMLVLVYAIVEAAERGWGSAHTLVLLALSAALLGAFVAIERRSAEPLVRLSLFRLRPLAAANASGLLVAAALFPLFFFASLYMQEVKGFSPIESGAGFLPFTLSVLVGAGLAQRTVRRFDPKAVTLGGIALAAAGLAYLSGLERGDSYAAALLPGLMMVGFGVGNAWVPLTVAATETVGADRQGLASGLINTSQQIGGALGLAVLSTVAAEHAESRLASMADPASLAARAEATVDGFAFAFLAGAALMATALFVVLAALRRGDIDVDEPGAVSESDPHPGLAPLPEAQSASGR